MVQLCKRCAYFVSMLLCLNACQQSQPQQSSAGGGKAAANHAMLRRGEFVYMRYCRICHGQYGAGDGRHAARYLPRPTNFRRAQFRHKSTPGDALPTSNDLKRVIRHGVPGTAMRAFDLPPADLDAVVRYLRTFSPRWQQDTASD